MTIEYKDSKRIVKLSSDVVETPTYTANYDDTNTWTKTGTKTTVNETVSGKVNWNFSSNYTSAENHVETTPLGFTLDNEKWVCDFEFNASAFDNAAENFLVVFQENAGDFISTSGDALACGIYSNKSLRLWKKDSSSHSIYGTGITISLNTDYYARMTRTLATAVKLELFTSEADRTAGTNHVSGSPITYTFSETIQGLDNLTHCGRSDNVGATRTYNVSLDNLKIWNGVASVSSKPTDVQDNSLLVEKDTANRYWFSEESETSSQTSTNDARSLKAGNRNKIGQQFNTGHALVGGAPTKVTFYLSKGGSPPNNVTAYIRNSSGTLRETSTTTIVANNLTGSAVATDFTFAGTTTLATGDMITIEYNSGDNTHYVNAWTNNSSAVTNSVLRGYTSSWSDISGEALKFIVYYTSATWNVPSKTPAEIGDLKVHYDATVGVTASSNSVSAWADQSGNGKTLSSVSNPTRVEAGQNGKDYLDFNSSKSMRATGLSETAPRPFTMVLVINPRNGGSQSIIRWSQNQYLALYQSPANTYYMSGGTQLNLTDSTLDGSWNAFFMDFKSNADGGTFQINLDTANAVSGTLGTNGTSGTTATLHVGINADNNNWHGQCRYAEIIMFDKVLTAYEKEQLYNHLKTKWGLP